MGHAGGTWETGRHGGSKDESQTTRGLSMQFDNVPAAELSIYRIADTWRYLNREDERFLDRIEERHLAWGVR